MNLTPLAVADEEAVLRLNEQYVDLTAPMDADRLRRLDRTGTVEVMRVDDRFAGFVATFNAADDHDADNFAWFRQRYSDFVYLDRVIVHDDFRRRGIASTTYDLIEQRATAPVLALEVNLEPPNVPSLAFHRGRGFEPVGEREVDDHRVVMLAKPLSARIDK